MLFSKAAVSRRCDQLWWIQVLAWQLQCWRACGCLVAFATMDDVGCFSPVYHVSQLVLIVAVCMNSSEMLQLADVDVYDPI
jgi:hypothetical protein